MAIALNIFKTLLSLFPLIVQAIQAVEAAFPNAKQGAAKLDIVKGMINSAFTTTNNAEVAFEQLEPGIESVVKTAVTLFNALGSFKAGVTPGASATPADDTPITTPG